MCGIAGYQGKNHYQRTSQSLQLIYHRGPDETVIKTFPRAGFSFGMNRLAIRDLSRGLYPFVYQGNYLVYNGEIYNVKELLKLIRYTPRSGCDGEIVLPLFSRYGVEAFDHLIGMFALAIYDSRSNKLILARDKFGEKPLYYQVLDDRIRFGSELKIFARGSLISSQAIFRYLVLGYQPFRSTVYDAVYKVQPGETVIIDVASRKSKRQFYSRSHAKIKPYISGEIKPATIETAVHNLDRLLKTIVQEKIAADVPVGVYLSGGVDSSLLAALISQSVSKKVKTFSIKFDAPDYDESSASQIAAKFLKTGHTEIIFSDKDTQDLWWTVIKKLDEPFADPAIFPTYLLSREAKKHVKVIISGEGADEFFGGYPHYRKHLLDRRFPRLPAWWARNLLQMIPSQKIAQLIGSPELLYTSAQYNTLWGAGFRLRNQYASLINETWENLDQIRSISTFPLPLNLFLYDLHYYVGEQLCMKIDKMTMLHSIESRAPYLDERLYPFMVLSAKLLEQNYQDKYLLRQVAKKYIPIENANKEKHGFSLPLEYWLRKGLRRFVQSAMNPHDKIQEIIPKETISRLIDGFLEYRHNDALSVWNIVILDSWLKEHVRS